ncbi:MAG: 3-deoxy-manno-octulosonate cytidylyltransferase [Candidatus Omnitrophota bacterium]
MEVIGIIPARYGSARFPGKVIADLNGKPMVQHVWERAKKSLGLDDLLIATDDERVKTVAEGFGAKTVMTAKEHKSGTDRLIEVIFSIDANIVLNIQADEPMIETTMIDHLADTMKTNPDIQMATVAKKINDQAQINDPNIVKVVLNREGLALYFSRSPIPYPREREHAQYYKHMGLYAYTKDFLFTFAKLRVCPLELSEGLEQLRALYNGYGIKVLEVEHDIISVDTPEDLERVKGLIKE